MSQIEAPWNNPTLPGVELGLKDYPHVPGVLLGLKDHLQVSRTTAQPSLKLLLVSRRLPSVLLLLWMCSSCP